VTFRPGRYAAAAPERDTDRRAARAWLNERCAATGDRFLGFLIVIAASMAWSPLLGMAVARDTIAARRAARVRLAEIGRTQPAVWVRQARRNALGWQRNPAASRYDFRIER
jgi:hypothetical protein